jgi:hypothetical protein
MGSAPPPHMFSNAAKSRGSRTQRTALVSPFGVCSVGLFVRTSSLWARSARTTITGKSMGHPLPPRRPGGIQPYTPAVATVKRCPFRHLSLPPVALAVLAPEATRSLTRRPARAIYRSRPRRHSARLTPAHDFGCPSTPGLRPS